MKTKNIILSTCTVLSSVVISLAQDTIFKVNNDIIIANILEISSGEIKYKRHDLPDGPVYVAHKADVLKIKYVNGTVDNFSVQPAKQENVSSGENKASAADLTPNYIVILLDGTQLKGKILKETKTDVVLLDNNIGERTISRKKIKILKPEFGTTTHVFTLVDGSVLTGKIVSQNSSVTVIETKDLGTVNLPASKIKSVREMEDGIVTQEGTIWFKNPNSTRYLFAPSAFCLKKGEGYYQNIYGAGNAVNYGLTDHISIGGGLVGPMGAYINTKIGTSINKNIHVAGGVLLGNSFFPINGNILAVGVGFGVVTVGNVDHNITVGTGYGLDNTGGKTTWQDKPLFVANGMARVGKKFALVTENWMVNTKGDPFNRGIKKPHYETYFSYAFRYMGQRSTLDAGFLNTPGLVEKGWIIGIPYIGFVIRFGKYKDE
jgi:hypothetical protein